ncbi:hypothetical protein RF11_09308 [Thelohanellus kitauei]|uniref:Uncharacterized protein n=1 Tax=Thelohanellus kitauei TaxID=669202 RepID=A0A0C2MT65_THEKT|nr:hypothetical protein RF11_09308 [Thelohanellus kitauei]
MTSYVISYQKPLNQDELTKFLKAYKLMKEPESPKCMNPLKGLKIRNRPRNLVESTGRFLREKDKTITGRVSENNVKLVKQKNGCMPTRLFGCGNQANGRRHPSEEGLTEERIILSFKWINAFSVENVSIIGAES